MSRLVSHAWGQAQIASIPFIRNIIEYTKGDSDPDFLTLTALLHWKTDSWRISQVDLDKIFHRVFGGNDTARDSTTPIYEVIHAEAVQCLNADNGMNFENKIVLSIAIRLAAEQYMIDKICDPVFVSNIQSNQTRVLLKKFKATFAGEGE
ncbi:MAG: phage infection protein, partial [Bryobacteraceae bacterium]